MIKDIFGQRFGRVLVTGFRGTDGRDRYWAICLAYDHYGGRGIKVCDRWQKFENFFQDMGPRPARKTIDRIDVNGNYEPSNCRWATTHEQMRNRRDNVHYEYMGRKQILPDWATEFSINPSTVKSRMKRGWSLERSLTEEVY